MVLALYVIGVVQLFGGIGLMVGGAQALTSLTEPATTGTDLADSFTAILASGAFGLGIGMLVAGVTTLALGRILETVLRLRNEQLKRDRVEEARALAHQDQWPPR